MKMSAMEIIKLTSSLDLFKQFLEFYGEVNSITYFGFTLVCSFH